MVPSGTNLGQQTFISSVNPPQIVEGWCGYGGSNKAVSVECDSLREEQLLQALSLIE